MPLKRGAAANNNASRPSGGKQQQQQQTTSTPAAGGNGNGNGNSRNTSMTHSNTSIHTNTNTSTGGGGGKGSVSSGGTDVGNGHPTSAAAQSVPPVNLQSINGGGGGNVSNAPKTPLKGNGVGAAAKASQPQPPAAASAASAANIPSSSSDANPGAVNGTSSSSAASPAPKTEKDEAAAAVDAEIPEDEIPGSPVPHRKKRGSTPIPQESEKVNGTSADASEAVPNNNSNNNNNNTSVPPCGCGGGAGLAALKLPEHQDPNVYNYYTPQPDSPLLTEKEVHALLHAGGEAIVMPKNKDAAANLASGGSDILDGSGPLNVERPFMIDDEDDDDDDDEVDGLNEFGEGGQGDNGESAGVKETGIVPSIMDISDRHKRIKRVSNYILGPVMGEGVYGVVRDAINMSSTGTNRLQRVAIKSVAFNTSKLSVLARRKVEKLQRIFENEIQILQRFHNPHVIRATDIFSRDGVDYIVLPIALCSLEQLIREVIRSEGPMQKTKTESSLNDTLSESTTLITENSQRATSLMLYQTSSMLSAVLVKGILFQILSGIQYLHKQGVAHNDVKPANVLLFANGVVKLTDLGSCGETFKGQGTPAFLSPEVCRLYYCIEADSAASNRQPLTGAPHRPSISIVHDAAQQDGVKLNACKNDMWCCGILLFYLLTGRIPYSTAGKQTEFQLLRDIVEKDINFDIIPDLQHDDTQESCVYSPGNNNKALESSLKNSNDTTSVKSLLRGLLDKNPATRLTADEALRHPWLAITSVSMANDSSDSLSSPVRGTSMFMTSVDDHVQHDVGRRVMRSKEIQLLMKRDRERHLQFVAEVCHVMLIAVPPIVFQPVNPEGNAQKSINNNNNTGSSSRGGGGGGEEPKRSTSTASSKYRGTVNRTFFLDERGQRYYERKGKPECDVRSFRGNPARRLQMMGYLESVIQECGIPNRRRGANHTTDDVQSKSSGLSKGGRAEGGGDKNSTYPKGDPRNRKNSSSTGYDPSVKEGSKCFCGLM